MYSNKINTIYAQLELFITILTREFISHRANIIMYIVLHVWQCNTMYL